MQDRSPLQPRVGVGAVITDAAGRILLVHRRRPPEAGHWSLPGGKVEWMEPLADALRREVEEELGLRIEITRLLSAVDQRVDHQHWVSPIFAARVLEGVPTNREPDRHADIGWFPLDALPHPVSLAVQEAVRVLQV